MYRIYLLSVVGDLVLQGGADSIYLYAIKDGRHRVITDVRAWLQTSLTDLNLSCEGQEITFQVTNHLRIFTNDSVI